MTAKSKPTEPFIRTDDLETLARELFNGALPALPSDGMKRRAALAKEFTAAHLAIPGVSLPTAAAAKLAPAFDAIRKTRQARADTFLASLQSPPTVAGVRAQLVAVLGERALQANLLHARHRVACALVLLDTLEGHAGSVLDLNAADGGKLLVDRLDDAFGKDARQSLLPRGVNYFGESLCLLNDLAEAVADARAGNHPTANPPTKRPASAPATKPAGPALSADDLGKQVRAENDPQKRAALFAQLQSLWKTQN